MFLSAKIPNVASRKLTKKNLSGRDVPAIPTGVAVAVTTGSVLQRKENYHLTFQQILRNGSSAERSA